MFVKKCSVVYQFYIINKKDKDKIKKKKNRVFNRVFTFLLVDQLHPLKSLS